MSKIAIDVVLVPSKEMTDKAIEINQELINNFEPKIILDKDKCLPHISLCMGCIDEEEIPELKEILDGIAQNFSKFDLVAEKLEPYTVPALGVFSGLEVKNTKELQALHEEIMQKFWKFLSYEVEKSMLINPAEIDDITLFWIRGYKKKYEDPTLFHPHITIGHGMTTKFEFPIIFEASKIAIFQLGNYCTCKKAIFYSDLNYEKRT